MRIAVRFFLLGVAAVLTLAFASAASPSVDPGEIVAFSPSTSSFLVETMEGGVTGSLPEAPGIDPGHFIPASDGSIVSDGEHGPVWLMHPNGTTIELDSSPYDFDASISYDGSKVTFARSDPATGASDIYVVNADGSGLTIAAGGQGNNYLSSPKFSPDGDSIAYACAPAVQTRGTGLGCGPTAEGTYYPGGVVLMGADGTNKRLILLGAGDIADPIESLSWSADGQWLTLDGCVNTRVGADSLTCDPEQIYAYRTDGSDLFNNLDPSRQVTHETGTFGGFRPQFCGDSGQILYLKTTDDTGTEGNFSYLINRDGSNRHELSLSPDGAPWGACVPPAAGGGPAPTANVVGSANGAGAAFVVPSFWLPQCHGFVAVAASGAFTECAYIPAGAAAAEYAVAVDGSVAYSDDHGQSGDGGPIWVSRPGEAPLEVDSSPYDSDLSISPDGSRISFVRADASTGSSDLYVVNADGSGLRLLASGSDKDPLDFPVFSPDGGSIAYADGKNEMLMNADGSNVRMIVQGRSGQASWSPDGQWLAMMGCIPKVDGSTLIDCDTTQLFTYRTDGSDLYNGLDPSRQVTHLSSQLFLGDPQFNADGSKIFFLRTVDDNGDEGNFGYVVSRDGSNNHEISVMIDPPVCQKFGGCFPRPSWGQVIPSANGHGPGVAVRPTQATVPNVGSLSYTTAKRRLAAKHLGADVTRRVYSSRIRRGHVVSQYPRARAQTSLKQKRRPVVKLVLSRGRRHHKSARR